MTCCPGPACANRVPQPDGGWACRRLLALGLLQEHAPPPPPTEHQPGWSSTAVLPCPRCGCRAYSPGPGGLPERRCWACQNVFNPELEVAR
jgi:hypothetical protein